MIDTTIIPKSRFGFHVCDYESFKKIKLLHKHYWMAKYKEGACKRYNRKHPKNRVIRKSNGVLLDKPIPIPEPHFPKIYKELLKNPIVSLYHQARYPHRDINTLKPLIINMNQINIWLEEIDKINRCI